MIDTTNRREDELPLSIRDIDNALQLVEHGQYELLAEFLSDVQQYAANNRASTVWHELLTMLHYLTLTCHLLNKSAIWHQQVGEQALLQLKEAKTVLRDFLHTLHDVDSETLANDPHLQVLRMPNDDQLNPNGHVNQSLWTRIKSIFQGDGWNSTATTPSTKFSGGQPHQSSNGHGQATAQQTLVPEVAASLDIPPQTQVNRGSNEPQTLLIYGLGVFSAYYEGKLINDWATRKSKLVFKYLLLNREKPVPKEILMEVFWPDSDETAARNNLNVTVYNLRQVFGKIDSSMSYALYQDDCYLLNPDLPIWFDYDVFRNHYIRGSKFYKQGQFEAAVREFQAAELVYQGELFEEDRYDDWLLPLREAAHNHYVQVLNYLSKYAFEQRQCMECINLCQKLLTVDACLEDTHRLLIKCYMQQGQNHLAIRQYYTCVEILQAELDVLPSQDTIALYQQITRK